VTTDGIITIFNEAAATYDQVGVDFGIPMGAELVRRARIRAGDRVLDVGCGRGAVLLPAAEAAGPSGEVIGIDLAEAMIDLTRTAVAELETVSVAVGDAQNPAFPPASFDVITAGLVLFFLPDPPAALTTYRTLLRPGGRLAFSTFAAYDPGYPRAMRTLAAYAEGGAPRPPEHEAFRSQESLRAAATAAGFTAVDITEAEVQSRFRDTNQFLEWVGSHGGRQILRKIPADRLPDATAAVAQVLDETGLQFTTRFRVVVAG
jgi:ubiquinone/menaquinone biosynthesis C-methylase UbiE